MNRPYAQALRQLNACGLRPTRQRLALAKLLMDMHPRHVTAEELFHEARRMNIPVSLATVYNTLHQFTAAGLLGEVVVGSGQSYFDTSTHSHWHYFDKATGAIIDVPDEAIGFSRLPQPPPGKIIERIDVVVRIRDAVEKTGGARPVVRTERHES